MRYLRDAPVYTIMPVTKTDGTAGLVPLPAPADPVQGATPPTGAPGAGGQPAATASPLGALGGFLDGSIFGIPTKYLLIGLAAWFFLKK